MRDKLNEQEINWVIEDVLHGTPVDETVKKLECKSRREFNQLINSDPKLKEAIEQANIDSCFFIENDMLNIHKQSKGDDKLARVMLQAKLKTLEFRNPAKYGPKLDLNLNKNVSIRFNLEQSSKRIGDAIKTVLPLIALDGETPDTKT